MRLATTVLGLALASAVFAQETASSRGPHGGPRELAATMARAGLTEGFRLRASIVREGAESWRVMIAGTKDEKVQHLALRVMAPEAESGQALVMEAVPGQAPKALHFGPRDATAAAADALAPFLETGLVPWDFTGEWWRWPRQVLLREEQCLGHACVVLESSGRERGGVAKVRSWVAPVLRLPMRLEFLAADGTRLREMRVESVFRRPDGSGAARAMTLTDARGARRRVDVYNGEEGIALSPETFSVPR